MSGIGSAHHILGIEHLLDELGDSKSTILLGTVRGKRSETSHEEMETGEVGSEVISESNSLAPLGGAEDFSGGGEELLD